MASVTSVPRLFFVHTCTSSPSAPPIFVTRTTKKHYHSFYGYTFLYP